MAKWSGSVWGPGLPTFSYQSDGLDHIQDKQTKPGVQTRSKRVRNVFISDPVMIEEINFKDDKGKQMAEDDLKKKTERKQRSKKREKTKQDTTKDKFSTSSTSRNVENEDLNIDQENEAPNIDTKTISTDQDDPTANFKLKVKSIPEKAFVLPAQVLGIRWEESLVTDKSLMSSPSHRNLAPATKSVLKKTQRDSGLFNEDMLSVLKNLPAETTYGKRSRKANKSAKKK